jgi:hypothetical protein
MTLVSLAIPDGRERLTPATTVSSPGVYTMPLFRLDPLHPDLLTCETCDAVVLTCPHFMVQAL